MVQINIDFRTVYFGIILMALTFLIFTAVNMISVFGPQIDGLNLVMIFMHVFVWIPIGYLISRHGKAKSYYESAVYILFSWLSGVIMIRMISFALNAIFLTGLYDAYFISNIPFYMIAGGFTYSFFKRRSKVSHEHKQPKQGPTNQNQFQI